jgi:hypothetical protein
MWFGLRWQMAETLPLWINRAVSAANQLLPEEDETGLEYQDSYKTWPFWAVNDPCSVLLQTCQAAACESLAAARLFNGIGNYLRERGQYAVAEPYCKRPYSSVKQLLEGKSP